MTFTDEQDDGHRVGMLSEGLVRELNLHIERFVEDVQAFPSGVAEAHPRLEYLVQSLKAAGAHISKLQDTLPHLRIAFGLTSRLYLEACGYIYYHLIGPPTANPQGNPAVNSHLVGVLVEDQRICEEYRHMGIPVWCIRKRTDVSVDKDRFVKSTEPRIYQSRPMWPSNCFRDDGIVRGEPVLLREQTDTGNFLKIVDSWVKQKLEDGSR